MNKKFIVSKTTLNILRVYFIIADSVPLWYGYLGHLRAYTMYISNYKVVFRYLLDKESLDILEYHGLFRENQNYRVNNITTIMAANPSNSSDWSTDSSWSIKYVGNVQIYEGSSSASSIISDKFDFNLEKQYWDHPITYERNQYIFLADSLVSENTFGGKMLIWP